MNSLSLSVGECVFPFHGDFLSSVCVGVCFNWPVSSESKESGVFRWNFSAAIDLFESDATSPQTHTHTSRQSPLQNTMQNIRVGHGLFCGASGER